MKDSGNIKVIEPTDDFKRIHKSIIRNKNIDCLTLGIYCKIVVLGADWQLNIKGLSKILGVSDNKVRASIGILEREGYIKREANYHDNKLDGWVYNVYPEPLKDEERSRAGYKKNNEDLQIQCCADSSVTQNQTTLESDITENREDNNNRLNIIENLKNNKTNNKENYKKEKEEIDAFVEKIYSMYPTKCPVRKVSLGKSYKDKDRIRRLLKMYSSDDIIRVVKNEVDEKYGKQYMSNFSTFLNNFPDPNSLFAEDSEHANGGSAYPQGYWQ